MIDNDIKGNIAGISVRGGEPLCVSGNRITGNALAGVEVVGDASVSVTENTVEGNGHGAVLPFESITSCEDARLNGNHPGIFWMTPAKCCFEDNVLRGNGAKGRNNEVVCVPHVYE